jgi:hypothetical protein
MLLTDMNFLSTINNEFLVIFLLSALLQQILVILIEKMVNQNFQDNQIQLYNFQMLVLVSKQDK